MKTPIAINQMKAFSLALLFSMCLLSFSSCEKDKETDTPSSYNQPTDVKTEAITVLPDEWEAKDDYYEVILQSKFYTRGQSYEYVKIYEKLANTKSTAHTWIELPTSSTYLEITSDYQIIIQKHYDFGNETFEFLVELKVKDI